MEPTEVALIEQLEGLGIRADIEPPGGVHPGYVRAPLRLRRGGSGADFVLVSGPRLQMKTLRAEDDGRPLFVHTPRIGTRTADAFRSAGIRYLDAAGNAWIEFDDVLIDVRGRVAPAQERMGNARAAGDLFTARRSQVVMVLLAWPQLWQRTRREVALAAGVSVGQVQNTIELLEQSDFRPRHPSARDDRLLDLWSAAFAGGLARRLEYATYRGDPTALTVPPDETVVVSGEAAVPDLLRPVTLTVYVPESAPWLAMRNRWRMDEQPNIYVRRKFWTTPPWVEPDLDRLPDAGRLRETVAPWPLVYADLLSGGQPRAREAAVEIRRRHQRV